MLQLFLQIPDQSTATRRGRSHFKETSLHDAETPLFSTVHFDDAETPLFSTDDLHAAETPLVDPLDLLLRPNNHHSPFSTFLCCRNTTIRNPPFFSITETPNSHLSFPHHDPTTFIFPHHPSLTKQLRPTIVSPFPFHAATPLLSTVDLFPNAETPLFSTFFSHSQNTTVHHFLILHH
jgi:hypothetical protein